MKITLNLATRPFADQGPAIRKLRIAMAVLAVAAIGLGVGLHMVDTQAEEARQHDTALEAKIAQVRGERQGYSALMREPANAALLNQVKYLNALFDEKAFSWTLAMEDLETVLPGGVQVTSIEPNREKDGHILLRLRVQGPRDKSVDLVRNLEHSRHFLVPRIVGESAENATGPGQAVQPVSAAMRENFELEAEYNPATAGDEAQAPKSGGADGPAKTERRAGTSRAGTDRAGTSRTGTDRAGTGGNAHTATPAGEHHRAPYRRLPAAQGGPR
ncbi:MAG TPA: fimbrial assembly protein [Terracidiphilus sp.]|nr:fimbrial assembly protein [Terracidiphilus sp.]